jgi:hypothetical protein
MVTVSCAGEDARLCRISSAVGRLEALRAATPKATNRLGHGARSGEMIRDTNPRGGIAYRFQVHDVFERM